MSRGFVIVAESTPKTNYLSCAEALAFSLKQVMPSCSVTVLTNDSTDCPYFDNVIGVTPQFVTVDPYKISNDIQAYTLSPYEYTIKLEADIFVPRSIEHWWDVLCNRDVVVSSTIRNFKGEISDCRVYRKFIDDNMLPDVYNAITYFRKSEIAGEFFEVVKNVLENWSAYKCELKCNTQEEPSTDWAYAIACHIIGVEKTTLPGFTEMSMTHMKQFVNGLPSENWTDVLVHEFVRGAFRVNTFTQSYPFHYHHKPFSAKIQERMYV